MDRRSKILAGAFGVFTAFLLIQRVVYPQWIEPSLSIDQRIAERQRDLDKLETLEEEVKRAKHHYRELVARNGSFSIGRIETEVRGRINKLIEKHHLTNMQVSRTKPARVGKTGLKRMRLVVKAGASLQSAVEFLRDMSELPQLIRIENARLYPAGSSRKRTGRRPVNLTVPIDLWLMPQHPIVGRIDESSLTPPEVVVRHEDRPYSSLWEGRPFSEYVPPVPLVARAGSPVNVTPRKRVTLSGSATGGEPPYTYKWSPSEGLSSPTRARTRVDTAKPLDQTYTLEVIDVNGKTASATVRVMVKERPPKPPKVVTKALSKKPLPKPKPIDLRWKQRKFMQLRMALLRSHGPDRLDEVMVYDKKKKRAYYYAVGDEFNGGELIFVHPTGGVVRRSGEYFIYPIGTWLDGEIKADDELAAEYPTLQLVAGRIRQADEEKAERERAGAAEAARKEKAGEVAPAEGKNGKTETSAPKPESGNAPATTSRPVSAKGKRQQPSEAGKNEVKIGGPERMLDRERRAKAGEKSNTKKPEEKP